MKWFLDTEFNDDGRTIELISLALVSERGDEYYAHSADYNVGACNDWVKQNVLPFVATVPPIPRSQIASEVRLLFRRCEATPRPEVWAYFADYDWVALCQLYGPMVNLPDFFPRYCRDLKQLMDDLGILRTQLPPNENAHDALADARWCREAYRQITGPQPRVA